MCCLAIFTGSPIINPQVELDLQESADPEPITSEIEYSFDSGSESRSTVSSGLDSETTTTTTTVRNEPSHIHDMRYFISRFSCGD